MKKRTDVPEIVERFLRRKNLVSPGEAVVSAVSGGADSLCMLLVLKELGYPLRVAHFDHRLRAESSRDSVKVRQIADRLGIPFTLGQGDVRLHADRNRMTLEEAARDLRYGFLVHTAMDSNASVIATGHTMNDQAETVLMHLIRGTGLRGLGGIRPVANAPGTPEGEGRSGIRIIRPLLCLMHKQAVEYCRQAGYQPIEDPSNEDTVFTRNRIRRDLIPHLETYNASIVDGLSRLADVARLQDEYVDQVAEDLWNRSAVEWAPGLVRLPNEVFKNAPAAIQQALARYAILRLTGRLDDLAYRHVTRILEFAGTPTDSLRMDLALGIKVSLENAWLVFQSPSRLAEATDWEAVELPVPGNLSIHNPDWKLELTLASGSELLVPESRQDRWTVWIDPDRIRMPLSLRKRRAGDSFYPLGMPCSVKLNDFLSSHHLPLSERNRWPLVCDANGIIWVPGFRVKEGISASEKSDRFLRIYVDQDA
jgi:tRNA(Ile)-lysidine synthase